MRHRSLTCKNHPDLRWSTKEVAWTPEKDGQPDRYNGARNIFFMGASTGNLHSDSSGVDCILVREDGSVVEECPCPPTDLILSPEDKLIEAAQASE